MTINTTGTRRANGEGSAPIRRKDGRWQTSIRFTDAEGKSARRTFTGATAADARRKLMEARRRVENGGVATDSRVLLAQWVDVWVDGPLLARGNRELVTRGYRQVARNHIADSVLGRTPLAKLTPSLIESWLLVDLPSRGLSQATRRRCYGILKMILDVAVRDGKIDRNPISRVKRPAMPKSQISVLDQHQVHDLIDAVENPTYRVAVQLLALTAIRRGEALALNWSDIDFDRHTVRIEKTLVQVPGVGLITREPKTAKSHRTIHLVPELEAALKAHRAAQNVARLASASWQPTGYVFTTSVGTPIAGNVFYRAVMVAAKLANLPASFHPHVLRHTAISLMLMAGVPLKTVSEIAGHSSIAITADTYGHVAPEVAADALGVLGAVMRAPRPERDDDDGTAGAVVAIR